MRDEKEGRKKEARKVKQTRQSNTAHPRQSLFLRKMSCLGYVGLEPTTLSTLDRATAAAQLAGPLFRTHLVWREKESAISIISQLNHIRGSSVATVI